jgi:hypothetical protein
VIIYHRSFLIIFPFRGNQMKNVLVVTKKPPRPSDIRFDFFECNLIVFSFHPSSSLKTNTTSRESVKLVVDARTPPPFPSINFPRWLVFPTKHPLRVEASPNRTAIFSRGGVIDVCLCISGCCETISIVCFCGAVVLSMSFPY